METAEVDGEARQVLSGLVAFDCGCHLLDTDGAVVVNAGRFGSLQFGIAALVEPLSRNGLVAKSDSTDGARRIAVFAGFAAWRIGAEEATRGFF